MKTWRIVQNIYEGAETEPTLTHVFYGESRERAEQVYNAHLKSDSFMLACTTMRRFRDFTCRAESHLEHLNARGAWKHV